MDYFECTINFRCNSFCNGGITKSLILTLRTKELSSDNCRASAASTYHNTEWIFLLVSRIFVLLDPFWQLGNFAAFMFETVQKWQILRIMAFNAFSGLGCLGEPLRLFSCDNKLVYLDYRMLQFHPISHIWSLRTLATHILELLLACKSFWLRRG